MTGRSLVPTVARLSVTPIKGLRLHHPTEIELTRSGALGDRRFFLVDEYAKPVSITANGALAMFRAVYDVGTGELSVEQADGRSWTDLVEFGEKLTSNFYGVREVSARVVQGPWNAVFSGELGKSLRLVATPLDATGFDIQPVTILGSASVDELARRADLDSIDARRFRMLIDLSTEVAHAEDDWEGQVADLGEAQLRIGGPVPRCAAVTRRPDHGDRDLQVVKLIRAYRGVQEGPLGPGVHFGVYASVVRGGTVRVGDELVLCG